MRKTIAMLGTLLIASVFIISGSAVAPWVDHFEDGQTTYCENPQNAVGAPGGGDASIGENPDTLGILFLDLGEDSDDWMGASQLFTVYGWSGFPANNIYETYNVTIWNDGFTVSSGPYDGWDSADLGFYTPEFPVGDIWRYYVIMGTSGEIEFENEDDIYYGPEIDAVGW